jgi:thioesterase domain-containing protein
LKSSAELAAAEEFLREAIPLTRAMEVRVVPHRDGFAIEAPVEPNHNHLDTAFGGSINAVATLAGYTLLWLEVRGRAVNLVVRESSIRFIRPIRKTIRAVCEPVAPDEIATFEERLNRDGRARLAVGVRVEENGELAAEFRATFLATAERAEHRRQDSMRR